MLDVKLIRENPEEVIRRLAAKGTDAKEDIGRILELDARRRGDDRGKRGEKGPAESRIQTDSPDEKRGKGHRPYFCTDEGVVRPDQGKR